MHDPAPLVSIITPSLNQGEFIANAIESVLAQDYPAIEYLVLDGGSTDGTLAILRGYGARVRWLSEPDGGQADALNTGFAMARGSIVAWLNADDRYLPGAVSRAVAALQAHPQAALVYGQAEFIDRAGRVTGPCAQVEPFDLGRLINQLDFVVQPATFFRAEAYAQVGRVDPSLRYCFDYDLWIRLAQRYPVRYLPERLAQVRVYAETKTASGGLARLDEIERMIARHGRRRLPMLFYGEMVRACWHAGWRALGAGRARQGARTLGRGLGYFAGFLLRKARYGR